jgi:hypothetical protein
MLHTRVQKSAIEELALSIVGFEKEIFDYLDKKISEVIFLFFFFFFFFIVVDKFTFLIF